MSNFLSSLKSYWKEAGEECPYGGTKDPTSPKRKFRPISSLKKPLVARSGGSSGGFVVSVVELFPDSEGSNEFSSWDEHLFYFKGVSAAEEKEILAELKKLRALDYGQVEEFQALWKPFLQKYQKYQRNLSDFEWADEGLWIQSNTRRELYTFPNAFPYRGFEVSSPETGESFETEDFDEALAVARSTQKMPGHSSEDTEQ